MKNNSNLPNLIIAGVTKGGSTSVFSYLADHPDVCASSYKELCYFMDLRFGKPLPHISEYKQYFTHCRETRYRMEASPGYFYGGRRLAKGIKDTLSNPKIIIILREPVKRFHSFFSSHKNKFIIDADVDFPEYIRRCNSLSEEAYGNPKNYPYFQLTNGCYSKYLPDWLEVFDQDLKVLFFDDLKNDNRKFMGAACNWLGIDNCYYDNYNFAIENKTRGVRLRWFHKVAMYLNNKFEKNLRNHMRIKKVIRNAYYLFNEARNNKSTIVNMEGDEFLKSYYNPYNRELRLILCDAGYQDLPDWLTTDYSN